MRRHAHAGPAQHRRPVDELAAAGLAEPRAALRLLDVELEQVAPERALQPRERGLDPVGRTPQRRLPPTRGRRLGLAARPPLEQPAERERRHLDREQLLNELLRGPLLGGVLDDHVRPLRPRPKRCRQTSTTTGRIIGRRRVRS